MVMFSQLRRFVLTDGQRQVKLSDASVALLESEYPPVTRLYFLTGDKERRSIPWSAVKEFDAGKRAIMVRSLAEASASRAEPPKKEALLGEDILDALLLDLQNRTATRANDLWVTFEDGQLALTAADVGMWGMLRRLTLGRYGPVRKTALHDWKYVEFLRGDPQAFKDGEGYHLRVARLPPGEIARLSDFLPYLHASELITLLPDAKAVDTVEALSPARQLQVFEELDEKQALSLLEIMAPDVAADLLGRLPTSTMRRYLNRLPKTQSERLIDLLRYPEHTVGGIMTNDVVSAPARLKVAQARGTLREALKTPDFVHNIYVVTDEKTRELQGVISLRHLFTAEDDELLKDIMDPYLSTLHPLDDANEGAYRVIDSHVAALPVVGEKGELIGLVTIDAAIAQVAPPDWRSQAPRIFS